MDRIDQQELENFLIKALDEDVKDGDHSTIREPWHRKR